MNLLPCDLVMTDDFWIPYTLDYPSSRAELAKIELANRRARRRVRSKTNEQSAQLAAMQAEIEFLSLTLTSLVVELDRKGTLTREDLREVMISVDQYDGVLDGKLPVMVLEELVQPAVLEEIFDEDGAGEASVAE